ncbi:penicillin-binding transpeptidase domain-containing protein [Massilia sp. R2A-15]|uniref:penicillin-binding transpeptidase domain-containing protein n=1 Tax=Massilia sp. R2A-15 TaxID=3064278 RepID=UPI002732F4E9|nr:penicillin-binding transpeptidase domain-containing protein [Massilia sp. R2A-15]WLI90925.1 penicillin-binding transpeptidase domain-containing protein [Massilia sp. R2A-15]
MQGSIRNLVRQARARHVAWRRARNLNAATRAGARPRTKPAATPALRIRVRPAALTAVHWIGAAGALAALGGALLLAAHARSLAVAGDVPGTGGLPHPVAAFQPALPGIAFSVPEQGGITVEEHEAGALLVAAGMRSAPPLRIDLCAQMAGTRDGRLLTIRIGYGFDEVARWAERAARVAPLRNVALSGPDTADMPRVQVSGNAIRDFAAPDAEPLQLRWDSADRAVRWIGDADWGKPGQGAHGQVALRRDGWLVWRRDAAMHIQRRAGGACPAGELVVQVVRTAPSTSAARAQVTAYPSNGQPVTAWLAAGRYLVPIDPARGVEDQALFQELRRRGMIRLGAGGLAELAPRDLAAWRAAPAPERAGQLAGWDKVVLDPAGVKVLRRLYRMADGEYVREQIRVFNGERRLLAWRVPQAAREGQWQASVAGAPASQSSAMPASAARLFTGLAQGWAPWTRIDAWPGGGAARLTLDLAQPAQGGEAVKLMLIGRAANVQGARVRTAQDACGGRACPSRDAAQVLVLELLPGARSVSLDATPLDMTALAMPGDLQYRHLRVVGGQLDWQQLAPMAAPRPAALAEVTLEDRNGVPLWSAGAPTRAAIDAGLAPLLGIRPDHASSVAGMLARLPAPGGTPHDARLTLDLALQAASQGALDCIGMRRGRWDGKSCSGGSPAPAGRHAGIVILDTETGDILAAAGAGNAPVSAANWNEVRNFDRTDPARSPLRLPALQHDGGAHSSPGSTFKVISAMGLEQAARRDPQLEALLAGMPLPAINRVASEKGFAFRTDASVYPVSATLAHITNYKDQHLDRRAQDGRLGLAQALTYSLNTWFAWSGELSDRSLFGRAEGGAPDLQPLEPGALDSVRPIVAMAHRLGFGQALRLDAGLLPADFGWSAWDALQASPSNIDPIHTRHELRQMSIGLRMQVTPLQMALAAGAVGQGRVIAPRLLLSLDKRNAVEAPMPPLGVRLDRIRAGMKGVVDVGTAAGAFRDKRFDGLRTRLSGKTGTAPTGPQGGGDSATVWFTGWLEPGSLPRQPHRLALAAFVSHSDATGGEHAAPVVAAVLASALAQNHEQKGK